MSPFRAAGLRAAEVQPGADAILLCRELIREGCDVVFYTEDLRSQLSDFTDHARETPVPCLVAIPAAGGGASSATERLGRVVRRALGINLTSELKRDTT